jgi:hypothetical protein
MVLYYTIPALNTIRLYDDTNIIFTQPITGISETELLVAIDIRPSNGLLYAIAVDDSAVGRLYFIPDPSTGVATQISMNTYSLNSIILDIDFDPVNDVIRLITDADQNITIDPDTGLSTSETSITGGTVVGNAYTNNVSGAVTTTLYAIGVNSLGVPTLFRIPVPSTGVLVPVAPLSNLPAGFRFQDAYLDIITPIPGTNQAYTIINFTQIGTGQPRVDFYLVDLLTGALTPIGTLDLLVNFLGLALIPPGPIPCLHPETKVSLFTDEIKTIQALRSGDVVKDYKGRPTTIINNMRFNYSDDMYLIHKDTLGVNQPSEDLLIRRNHPILYNGKERDAKRLSKSLGKDKVHKIKLDTKVAVWSLCTKERTFVMMQGVPVCTWSEEDIKNYKGHHTKF